MQDEFPVKRVFQGRTLLEKVSTIKAKKADYSHWFFAVLDRENTPLMVFPTGLLELLGKKDPEAEEVSFTLKTKLETVISIEFNNSIDADKFYEFLDERLFKSSPRTIT